MPDRQGFAVAAQQHLLMRDQSRQPYRVDVDAPDGGAPGTFQLGGGGVRRRFLAGGGD
jgi:hypothetical protein